MKKVIIITLLALFSFPVLLFARVSVRGHMRDSDGDGIKDQYISPYQRTRPNGTKMDNYSYPGNYNPNTGDLTPMGDGSNKQLQDPYNDGYRNRGYNSDLYDDE